MASKDLKNNIDIIPSIVPAAVGATTTNGTGIDLKGFDAATAVVTVGALAVGTFTIEESDAQGSGFSAAAAGDVIGSQGVAVVQSEAVTLGYVGSKRYIRVVLITSTGDEVCANIIRSTPAILPTESN